MKKFKLFLGMAAIMVFALQPMSSALAFGGNECDFDPQSEHITFNAKKKWFSSNCKLKCDHICNNEKRDLDLTISFF